MEYEILDEYYRIKLYGKPEEIKTFLEETDEVFTKSNTISMIQEDLDNIETLVDTHNFDFGYSYQRLYYNKNEITYLPNVNGKAREFHFKILKTHFEKIKTNFEKKYEMKEKKTKN